MEVSLLHSGFRPRGPNEDILFGLSGTTSELGTIETWRNLPFAGSRSLRARSSAPTRHPGRVASAMEADHGPSGEQHQRHRAEAEQDLAHGSEPVTLYRAWAGWHTLPVLTAVDTTLLVIVRLG